MRAHSLVNRDLAMPTNITDPKSGQTYFQAASAIASYLKAGGNPSTMPAQPFFEHLWATAAAGTLSATQVIATDAKINSSNGADFTTTLTDIDLPGLCNQTGGTTFNSKGSLTGVACGIYGPNMEFNNQFSALSAWSSIGKGNYHGLQFTMRKRFSGLTVDLNYTFSKSIDLGSSQENAGSFSGFIQNTWNVSQERAVSGYDTTHIVNASGIWEIPVGRNKKFLANSSKVTNALVGGWQITGIWTQTSGFPISINNPRLWPTNWNITPFATPNGNPLQPVVNTGLTPGVGGSAAAPNLGANPTAELAAFTTTLPGQSGSRNTIRGAGNFDIDTGLAKRWLMPFNEKHSVQLRAEAFNITNSVRFDPASAGTSIGSSSSFGKLTGTLTTPRQIQFALRYEF